MGKKILHYWIYLAVCTFFLQAAEFLFQPSKVHAAQPNIILINVDNMGRGDLCKNNPDSAICQTKTLICDTSSTYAECAQDNQCKSSDMKGCVEVPSHTPRLDSLANEGVTLTNFYTPVPICTPSRAALMTGLDPLRNGITATPPADGTSNVLLPSAWTIAEELTHLNRYDLVNYNTAIIGKWQLGLDSTNYSWAQGFEYNYVLPMGIHYANTGFCLAEKFNGVSNPYWQHVDNILPGGLPDDLNGNAGITSQLTNDANKYCPDTTDTKKRYWVTNSSDQDYDYGSRFNQNSAKNSASLTEILTDKAIGYLVNSIIKDENSQAVSDQRTAGNPFFLYLAYPAPHSSLRAHLGELLGQDDRTQCQIREGRCKENYNASCVHACELDFYYDEVIKELDGQIGRLSECVKGNQKIHSKCTDISSNTIIIFTSDNGPFIGQNGESLPVRVDRTGGRRGGQKHNYEGGVNVPFIAYWPGRWTGAKVLNHPADMMDIYATLVQVAKGINQGNDTCNTPVSVENARGQTVSLDGKNIANVLQNGTDGCGGQQRKDIHTAWLHTDRLSGSSCNSWTNIEVTPAKTWTLGSPVPNWTWNQNWTKNPDGLCSSDLTDWNKSPQYPFALRSYDPQDTLHPDLFKYKLYFDSSLRPVKLYDLSSNPAEKDGLDLNLAYMRNYTQEQDILVGKVGDYRNQEDQPWTGKTTDKRYKYYYYLPSIKDNDGIGWQNWLTVMAKEPAPMDVKLKVHDMGGSLKGTYIYSDTDPAADKPSIKPNERVAQRPSYVVGTVTSPVPVEGSMVIETSVPATVNTNTIAYYGSGFDIYEAPRPRSVHTFTQAWDGPVQYKAYILIQNIYGTERNVTIKLFGKTNTAAGHGATQTVTIPPYGTYIIRPCEVAELSFYPNGSCGDTPNTPSTVPYTDGKPLNFQGYVKVFSNLSAPEEGLGLPIPVMNRYENDYASNSNKGITIYESAEPRRDLYFPHMKDGKFGKSLDYQNYLSIMNPGVGSATVSIVLYSYSGVKEGELSNEIISAGEKKTWRPIWIKSKYNDMANVLCDGISNAENLEDPTKCPSFEGSIVVTANIPMVGQTNVMYNSTTDARSADTLAVYESATPASSLNFSKAFDNRLDDYKHLYDNYIYIQNPDDKTRKIKIQLFGNSGVNNGETTVDLGANKTHVFQPRCYVGAGGKTPTDGNVAPSRDCAPDANGIFVGGGPNANFRGSIMVTENDGKKITSVLKYEVHTGELATSLVGAVTVFRSMGE